MKRPRRALMSRQGRELRGASFQPSMMPAYTSDQCSMQGENSTAVMGASVSSR